VSLNTKIIFKAPQVGTLDMRLSKQSTSSGAGCRSGRSYAVLHNQAQKNSFQSGQLLPKYESR
jgi:hypothetical protein